MIIVERISNKSVAGLYQERNILIVQAEYSLLDFAAKFWCNASAGYSQNSCLFLGCSPRAPTRVGYGVGKHLPRYS